MCGINGIFAYHYAADTIQPSELARTRDHMSARGPDAYGAWIAENGRVGFGHRRLSIIDLSDAGAQPMISADGKLIVTFNGEIYNYRELRLELEGKGHVFRSHSDTEVLLHLYAAKGADMVDDLRGMFAFAIWDADRRELFAARDRFGIKPFYYADDGWTFRFASQVKALLAGGACSKDPDPAGHVGFYIFGAVPEPFTTYAAIRALPAGCALTVGTTGLRALRRYYSLSATYRRLEDVRENVDDAHAVARAALLDSVRNHLVADVPVGAFLSAGIDSGALVGLMRDAGQSDISTVTLGFAEFAGSENDETKLAKRVAKHYGTQHVTRMISEREFTEDFPRIMAAMDQPSIDGFNTWFVSKAARELGLKVAISGLGGDELLGGYPSFQQVPRLARALRWPARVPLIPGLVRRFAAAACPARLGFNPKIAGLLECGGTIEGAYLLRGGLFMPWELPRMLGQDFAAEGLRRLQPLEHLALAAQDGPRTPFAQLATLEGGYYMRNQLLRDTDWASMAHSLEVRVPLVDHRLLEAVTPYALAAWAMGGRAKTLLAAAPALPLSEDIVNRRKTGFSTPVAGWIRKVSMGDRSGALACAHVPALSVRELAKLVLSR